MDPRAYKEFLPKAKDGLKRATRSLIRTFPLDNALLHILSGAIDPCLHPTAIGSESLIDLTEYLGDLTDDEMDLYKAEVSSITKLSLDHKLPRKICDGKPVSPDKWWGTLIATVELPMLNLLGLLKATSQGA